MATLNDLTSYELAALYALVGDALMERKKNEIAEGSSASVDMTVRVTGVVKRGVGYTQRPTSRLLNLGTVAVLLKRAGVTRETAKLLLRDVLRESARLNDEMREQLVREYELEQTIQAIQDEIVENAPRVEVAGRVTAKLDVSIERNTQAAQAAEVV